jgi:nitroreductase
MEKPARNDYPIHDLLKRRWSPRAFADRPVEIEKLRSLFEAARWAPSSFNEQPWAFVVATKNQPTDYAKVLGCLVDFNQTWAKAAPVLLLTLAHLAFERNQQPNRHAYHDLGLAVANLTVQATAEGLFVHQMAGIVPPTIRATFAVPDSWDAVSALAIGYPGEDTTLSPELQQRELTERTRKPLSAFTFSGSWGSAASIFYEPRTESSGVSAPR